MAHGGEESATRMTLATTDYVWLHVFMTRECLYVISSFSPSGLEHWYLMNELDYMCVCVYIIAMLGLYPLSTIARILDMIARISMVFSTYQQPNPL